MVASMVIRSIIVNRTGVSRGDLGEFGGNLQAIFKRKGVLGENLTQGRKGRKGVGGYSADSWRRSMRPVTASATRTVQYSATNSAMRS